MFPANCLFGHGYWSGVAFFFVMGRESRYFNAYLLFFVLGPSRLPSLWLSDSKSRVDRDFIDQVVVKPCAQVVQGCYVCCVEFRL